MLRFATLFCAAAGLVADLQRLVILPDAHGDRIALESALELANVPLNRGAADSDTTVVSLGDSVDRGPDPRGCYEVLKSVNAKKLLGNHDWLNLVGVAPKDDPKTPQQENLFFPYVSDEDLQSFGGWTERQQAFGPQGELGKAIREEFDIMALLPSPWKVKGKLPPLDAAATLLMHAGIMSKLALRYNSVEEMIAVGRDGLSKSLNGDDSVLLGAELFDHVLQDRTLAYGKEAKICPDLEKTLAHLGAARLIVGHTPQERRRAKVRCGGRLVLLDIAMSRWLMNMDRPEKTPHSVALELTFAGDKGEERLTKSPRLVYHDKAENMPPLVGSDEL